MPFRFRLLVFVVVATIFYVAALSNELYTIASPPSFSFHIVLRKLESVVAFTIVGLSLNWCLVTRQRRTLILALSIAAYSALIEIGQRVSGSHEPIAESMFDVLCGAVGGGLAGLLARATTKRARDSSTGAR